MAATGAARSSVAIVQDVARSQAAQGTAHLSTYLSAAERAAATGAGGSRFFGQAAHRATAEALEAAYPGRFTYSTRGPDFLDTVTNRYVELTTPGQLAGHQARYGPVWGGRPVDYVTYQLP